MHYQICFRMVVLACAAIAMSASAGIADDCAVGEMNENSAMKSNVALLNALACLGERIDELEFENASIRETLEAKETANVNIPRGVVLLFDRSRGCPNGWEDLGSEFRGRVPVAAIKDTTDTYGYRQTGGEATHTLTIDEIPTHSHNYLDRAPEFVNGIQYGQNGNQGINWPDLTRETSAVGGGQPHNNMPPYVALYFCKKD